MKTAHFEIILGGKPVLLSSPHSFVYRRPKLSMGYSQPESYTNEIVKAVCEKTGAWGIVLIDNIEYDPNYSKEKGNLYKQEVRKLVKENSITQFLDIHGLRSDMGYDLGIYYATRFTRSKDFADIVKEEVEQDELSGISVAQLRFLEDDQETLGEFCAKELRIPSIQIEIASYIREEKSLRESFVENLSEIINKRFV